jgi:hypothetical protein
MGGPLYAPAALTPGKELPEPVWTSGQQKNIFTLPGSETLTVQPAVRSLYQLLQISLSACNISNASNINIHIDNGLLTYTFLII